MAIELERFLQDQLERLPEDHPDRSFLAGLHTTVAAYTGRERLAGGETKVLYTGDPTSPEHGADRGADDVVAETEQQPARSEQERSTYYGRVAAKPDFQTLPRGGRRGHFPLATHPSSEETVYYDVYTWNKPGKPWTDRLEQLKLQRGQAVHVIGYVHDGGTKKDGTPKPQQIYAGAPIKVQ